MGKGHEQYVHSTGSASVKMIDLVFPHGPWLIPAFTYQHHSQSQAIYFSPGHIRYFSSNHCLSHSQGSQKEDI